jgi:hypothetical protein
MPRLPGISQRQAVRVFQKLGYRVVRESGHLIMSNGVSRLVIPRHDPINAITMGAIARDAGLTPEQFRQLLRRLPPGSAPCGARVSRVLLFVRYQRHEGERIWLVTEWRSAGGWSGRFRRGGCQAVGAAVGQAVGIGQVAAASVLPWLNPASPTTRPSGAANPASA